MGSLDEKWFASYAPYTITKYGMSMLTLGMNQEFASYGVSVNSLWPRTIIATAALLIESDKTKKFTIFPISDNDHQTKK